MENEKLVLKRTTIRFIATSRGFGIASIEAQVLELQSSGVDKAEIYRRLMSGFGDPTTYVSGKPEDELKLGGKNIARHRSNNNKHH